MKGESTEGSGMGVGGVRTVAMVWQLCLLQGEVRKEWNWFSITSCQVLDDM